MARTKTSSRAKTFQYVAIDPEGKRHKGKLQAASRDEALGAVRRPGWTILQCDEQSGSMSAGNTDIGVLLRGGGSGGVKLKTAKAAAFIRALHQLLRAGMPVAQALDALALTMPEGPQRTMVQELEQKVSAGTPLAEAMKDYPHAFSPVMVAYISTAEVTGSLAEGTEQLANMLEKRVSLDKKVKAATTYPKLVSGIIGLLVLAIIIFLVPMYADIYEQFGAPLPLPTLILTWVAARIPFILGGIIAVFVTLRIIIKRNKDKRKFAEKWDAFKFRLPIFGKLARELALYRWVSTLAGASASGVRLEPALRLAGQASGSGWIKALSDDAAVGIASGRLLSNFMGDYPEVFPPQMCALIATGEKAGDLESMLSNSALSLSEDIDTAVQSLGSKIEVLLLMVMAVVVGGLLVVLYLPILNLMSVVMDGSQGGPADPAGGAVAPTP